MQWFLFPCKDHIGFPRLSTPQKTLLYYKVHMPVSYWSGKTKRGLFGTRGHPFYIPGIFFLHNARKELQCEWYPSGVEWYNTRKISGGMSVQDMPAPDLFFVPHSFRSPP